jgi:hypothetical protein
MARRARSSANPAWIAVTCLLCLILAGGGYWVYSQISDPFRTLSPLPVAAYLENSNGLRGNVYRVNGTVANQLGWSPTTGRLYSIDVDNTEDVLPILIPAAFNATNLQKGQRFTFEIEVGERGILQARNLRKV